MIMVGLPGSSNPLQMAQAAGEAFRGNLGPALESLPGGTANLTPDASGYTAWDYIGNMFTGEIDYARNASLAEAEHQSSLELMNLQNAHTAEREDLAWSRYMDAVQADRAWQEQMSNTEIQRRVADLKKAGLNPMMAALGNGASSGSGGVSGYSSASSASAQALKYPAYKLRENVAGSIGGMVKSIIAAFLGLKILSK